MARRPVGQWLLMVAAAVVVQVALGGITRLTDSGLSITEWKPILGVVPPSDEAGWTEAFGKYQHIPQFQRLKSHLTLEDFKVIYFWEWFHRLWGRLLGVFFVVPLIVFWRQGRLDGLKAKLLGLLALGGAQGVMGWVMVASGLQDLVYVSHLRLAVHFLLAAALLAALVWMGEALVSSEAGGVFVDRRPTLALLGLLTVQLAFGAFMAGLKAGVMAPTWPTINGEWVPSAIMGGGDWWWNDPLAIHFVHRSLAYALVAGLAWWWWRAPRALGWRRHAVLALVVAQTSLGVATVLVSVDPGRLLVVGVVHQLCGLALMAALLSALRALWPARASVVVTPIGHEVVAPPLAP